MNKRHAAAVCPRYHYAIELIGRRWTGAVLRAMLSGAARFSDIRQSVPGMSDTLLSERLKELEAAEVLTRLVVPSTPVRVEYHLTEKGADLLPAIQAVGRWAEQWAADEPCTCDPATSGPTGARPRKRIVSGP